MAIAIFAGAIEGGVFAIFFARIPSKLI